MHVAWMISQRDLGVGVSWLVGRAATRICGGVLLLAVFGALPAQADSIRLLSDGIAGDTPAGETRPSALSADGRYMVVNTRSSGWVPGIDDTNGQVDCYLWDRMTDSFTLVTHAPGNPNATTHAFSWSGLLTPNGRFVVFDSFPLDAPMDAATWNVYMWDRDTGEMTLVSHDAGNLTSVGNGHSHGAAVSDDGAYVLFGSEATDLVDGMIDANDGVDLFLWERATGEVRLVSHAESSPATTSNGLPLYATLSADGRYVVFASWAADLVAGFVDQNGSSWDVFLWDRDTGLVTLVSHAPGLSTTTGNDHNDHPRISADGRFVVFVSRATDLVAGMVDANYDEDVFVWDRATGVVTLVSHRAGTLTTTASGGSFPAVISADGAWVAFRSGAADLLDPNGTYISSSVYLWERASGAITLVSHSIDGPTTPANGHTMADLYAVNLSADGRFVVFGSFATDLIADYDGCPESCEQVYVWDRTTGAVRLVSATPATASISVEEDWPPIVSSDGQYVAFTSHASNLVSGVDDTNDLPDAFLWGQSPGSIQLVSAKAGSGAASGNWSSRPLAMSANGHSIAFASQASSLSGIDVPYPVYVTDYERPYRALVWDEGASQQAHVGFGVQERSSAEVPPPAMSADGRYLAFEAHDPDVLPSGTLPPSSFSIYLVDRDTSSTTQVSGGGSRLDALSPDGRWLVSHTVSSPARVSLWDRTTGSSVLVSHVPSSPTTNGNGESDRALVSDDGAWVAFRSEATNLITGGVDGNAGADVFLFERATGLVSLASHSSASATTAGDGASELTAFSGDGRYVVISSSATDLVTGVTDSNGGDDIFVFDRVSGVMNLVSHAAGSAVTTGDGASTAAIVSSDGRYVVFASSAADLVAGSADTNGVDDVFRWDRTTGDIELVSHVPAAPLTAGGRASTPKLMTPDGMYVVFSSAAEDLVPGGPASFADNWIFLWEADTGEVRLVSHADGDPTTPANEDANAKAISADGCRIAFSSLASNLVSGDFSGDDQAFLWSLGEPDVTGPAGADFEPGSGGGWSMSPVLSVSWSGAADERCGSGVAGYSVLVDQAPATEPDDSLEVAQSTDPHSFTTDPLADGSWYVHVAACDEAGNCAPAIHAGVFGIDTVAPSAPGVITSPSHDGGPSNDPTIDVAWLAASDGLAGVAGYGWAFTASASWSCDSVMDGGNSVLEATSSALGSGDWWFHVCAVDEAGNWGPVTTGGPWTVDVTAPTAPLVSTTADTGDGVLSDGERTAAPITQLRIGFSEPMNQTLLAEPTSWRLVGDGGDGVVTTPSCIGGIDPQDEPLAIDAIAAGSSSAVLSVGGGRALSAGHYVLLVCDVLEDALGNAFDGDGDGLAGGDLRRELVVVDTDLLANPNVDTGLGGWVTTDGGAAPAWDSSDADGIASSGSLRVSFGDAMTGWASASQCVDLDGPGLQPIDLHLLVSGGTPGDPTVQLELKPYAGPACALPVEPSSVVDLMEGPTLGWERVTAGWNAPPGTASVAVSLTVTGASGTAADVHLDRLSFGASSLIFADDFESGGVNGWGGARP